MISCDSWPKGYSLLYDVMFSVWTGVVRGTTTAAWEWMGYWYCEHWATELCITFFVYSMIIINVVVVVVIILLCCPINCYLNQRVVFCCSFIFFLSPSSHLVEGIEWVAAWSLLPVEVKPQQNSWTSGNI